MNEENDFLDYEDDGYEREDDERFTCQCNYCTCLAQMNTPGVCENCMRDCHQG